MDEEKVYCSMYSRNAELYHHGIQGQKWGVQNGPPYPLDSLISTGKKLKRNIDLLKDKSENKSRYLDYKKMTYKQEEEVAKRIINDSKEYKDAVKKFNNSQAVKFQKELQKNLNASHSKQLVQKIRNKQPLTKMEQYINDAAKKSRFYSYDDLSEALYEVYEMRTQNHNMSAFYHYCKDKGLNCEKEVQTAKNLDKEILNISKKLSEDYFGNYYDYPTRAFTAGDSLKWVLYDQKGFTF